MELRTHDEQSSKRGVEEIFSLVQGVLKEFHYPASIFTVRSSGKTWLVRFKSWDFKHRKEASAKMKLVALMPEVYFSFSGKRGKNGSIS